MCPRQRNDVQLPLSDSVPRDRYVPRLANVNIYSQINDQGSLDLQAKLDELAIFMRYVGNYQPYPGATAANRELSDEIEAPQMILCDAWKLPSGEIPEAANGYWYALLTPGIQPRENLLSQGTYHLKEISRNGNFAFLIVCHPTIGERYVRLWWREAGYRAEVTGELQNNGCQVTYEIETYREDTYGVEDIYVFSFGEQVFSASDLQTFPRQNR